MSLADNWGRCCAAGTCCPASPRWRPSPCRCAAWAGLKQMIIRSVVPTHCRRPRCATGGESVRTMSASTWASAASRLAPDTACRLRCSEACSGLTANTGYGPDQLELAAKACDVNRWLPKTIRVGQSCVLASRAIERGPPATLTEDEEGPGPAVRRPSGHGSDRRFIPVAVRRRRHRQREPPRRGRPAAGHPLQRRPDDR